MGNLTAPVQALLSRLEAHCPTGSLLAGLNFVQAPTGEVAGEKDLPSLRVTVPNFAEDLKSDSRRQSITLSLILATKRQVKTGNPLIEHLTWLEKLLDALDTDPATGAIELSLGATLAYPLTVKTSTQYALDLSINSELTLVLVARAVTRGSMREERTK